MKRVASLTLCLLIIMSSLCFARRLPYEEFSLGGICVTSGMTIDDVRNIYGEPEMVESLQYSRTYMYGNSVKIKTWRSKGGSEQVHFVETTENNGFGTPAGLTVGMKASKMFKLYGDALSSSRDKKTGWTEYVYSDINIGAGAGMFIQVDQKYVIRNIKVID